MKKQPALITTRIIEGVKLEFYAYPTDESLLEATGDDYEQYVVDLEMGNKVFFDMCIVATHCGREIEREWVFGVLASDYIVPLDNLGIWKDIDGVINDIVAVAKDAIEELYP